MKIAVKRLLFEAYRRNKMGDECERSKPLPKRWLGLGTAAAYRPVLEAGLMDWHDGKAPPKRCMGWLVLTAEGEKAMAGMEEDFKARLDRLLKDKSYVGSYLAHYQLAGGLVS